MLAGNYDSAAREAIDSNWYLQESGKDINRAEAFGDSIAALTKPVVRDPIEPTPDRRIASAGTDLSSVFLQNRPQSSFDQTISEDELWDKYDGKAPEGKIVINDRIADNMLQQILTRTDEYDVLALPNLNGDYMSDACAAQIGGLGLAPGANIGDEIALFEATHGTAPKYAGQDKVNPGSVILSGVMMFEHMGWRNVAELIVKALEKTVLDKDVTYDLHRQIEGANLLKCSEFGDAIIKNMDNV